MKSEDKNVEVNITVQEKNTEVVSVTEEKENTVDRNEKNVINVIINVWIWFNWIMENIIVLNPYITQINIFLFFIVTN